jgi:hypothetical protein
MRRLNSSSEGKPDLAKNLYPLTCREIVGHAHITVQKMQSADSTALLDPTVFAFFKGLDFADGPFPARRYPANTDDSEWHFQRGCPRRLGGWRIPSLHDHV